MPKTNSHASCAGFVDRSLTVIKHAQNTYYIYLLKAFWLVRDIFDPDQLLIAPYAKTAGRSFSYLQYGAIYIYNVWFYSFSRVSPGSG